MGMANTVCGTPYYFSPELCRNKPYNNKTDVWAAGVLLYELAALKHPFDGTSMTQLMQRIVRSPFPPLPLSFSAEFRELVRVCLEKEHARRPTVRGLLVMPMMRSAVEQLSSDLAAAQEEQTRLQNVVAKREGAEVRPQPPVTPPPKRDGIPAPRPVAVDPRFQKPQPPPNERAVHDAMAPVNQFVAELGKPVNQILREREREAAQARVAEDARRREAEKIMKDRQAAIERDRRARGQAAAAKVRKQEEERQKNAAQREKHLAELRRVMDDAEKRRKGARAKPRPDRTPSPQAAKVAKKQPQPVTPPLAANKRPTPGAAYVERDERPAVSNLQLEKLARADEDRRAGVAKRAQNWVEKEHQRKMQQAEQRRKEEAEAVRNMGRIGQGKPAIDPDLAAWVRQEGGKKDNLASPKPVIARVRTDALRRSVDEVDRVLRQQGTGFTVERVGKMPAAVPRSITPPPSPSRAPEFSPMPGVRPTVASESPLPRKLNMDLEPAKPTLWQRRVAENGGAEPQLGGAQEVRTGRPRALSHTQAPPVREASAPPVMSPVRAAAQAVSPGKEMISTVSFQEVPTKEDVDVRLKRKQPKNPSEFSDEESDSELAEDALLEANERSNSDDAQADYDAMRTHIQTVLAVKGEDLVREVTDDVVVDESDDDVFGDDAPMSPGGAFEVPEEDHVFRLAHLCGEHFTGGAPVFLDGRPVPGSRGGPAHQHAASAMHAEHLRSFLTDEIGLDVVVDAYRHLSQVDGLSAVEETVRAAHEQHQVELARQIIADAVVSACNTDDDELGHQEDVQQYLSFMCQLLYFDEELNRQQG
jgi:hypothetical protein